MKSHYSTFDAERILEIKRTRLQEWLDRNYIVPFHKAKGKGDKTRFVIEDLYKIKLFQEFLDRRIKQRERAAYLLSILDKEATSPTEEPRKVDWGRDYFSYIEFSHDEHPKLKDEPNFTGSYHDKFPSHDMEDHHIFQIIINLKVIKRLVDKNFWK